MISVAYKLIPVKNLNQSQNLVRIKLNNSRSCSGGCEAKEYEKHFRILGIPNNSDQETVRRAFIDLCKKYHPDSSNSLADVKKFQEIESAYRVLQNKFASERWNVNEGIGEYGLYYTEKKNKENESHPKVFDIEHTAPQHRQYLSYEGVGSGTPSQREKQYIKYRTMVAAENVYDHHIKKITATEENSILVKDKHEAKKIKTRYGMERLVEDLIQESMAKGHFNNLKGQGKPLPQADYNPYVDYTTHKINQIMIENGFVPEWINLQKEIVSDIDHIKGVLWKERKKLGRLPLDTKGHRKWREVVDSLMSTVEKLNSKINKFNLVVPVINKQKIYFNLERESCDILNTDMSSEENFTETEKEKDDSSTTSSSNIFNFLKMF